MSDHQNMKMASLRKSISRILDFKTQYVYRQYVKVTKQKNYYIARETLKLLSDFDYTVLTLQLFCILSRCKQSDFLTDLQEPQNLIGCWVSWFQPISADFDFMFSYWLNSKTADIKTKSADSATNQILRFLQICETTLIVLIIQYAEPLYFISSPLFGKNAREGEQILVRAHKNDKGNGAL